MESRETRSVHGSVTEGHVVGERKEGRQAGTRERKERKGMEGEQVHGRSELCVV